MIIDARRMLSNNHEPGDCAVCGGKSENGGPVKKAVSGSFTDWQALMVGAGRRCCPECKHIIGIPQMRSKCVVCVKDGDICFVSYQEVLNLIKHPPERFVVSIPYSFKRHHWLYAGISTPERMLIGTDSATVEYRPKDHLGVLQSIETMIGAGVSAKQIESGNYHPASIALLGTEYEKLEDIISVNRGSGLVKFLCKICPKEKIENWEVEVVRTTEQNNAAFFLSTLATHSQYRIENGLQFWGGFFESRINRVLDFPFDVATSKLMESLHCSTNCGIAKIVDTFTEEQKEKTMQALREQGKLCISLAYSDMKKERIK